MITEIVNRIWNAGRIFINCVMMIFLVSYLSVVIPILALMGGKLLVNHHLNMINNLLGSDIKMEWRED